MRVEIAVYFIFAIVAAGSAFFTFRNANRLKAKGDKANHQDQSLAGIALSILAIVLVIFGTHHLG